MDIQIAGPEDYDEVISLVQRCMDDMQGNGIDQWNSEYPKFEIFKKDLSEGTLFKMMDDGKIIGMIVLSEVQDKEYEEIEWEDNSGNFLVVHRLATDPGWQRKGIAWNLMDFAEEYAVEKGYSSIRTDTYSGNPKSLRFFEKRGYSIRPGHIGFPECPDPYYCYEIPIPFKR